MGFKHRKRLLSGQATRGLRGVFAGESIFIEMRRDDLELGHEATEKLLSTRRGAGKDHRISEADHTTGGNSGSFGRGIRAATGSNAGNALCGSV